MNRLVFSIVVILLMLASVFAADYSYWEEPRTGTRYVSYDWSCENMTEFCCNDGYCGPCGTACAGACDPSGNCGNHDGGWTNVGSYGECCTASGYSGTFCTDHGSLPKKKEEYTYYVDCCSYVSSVNSWTECSNHTQYATSTSYSSFCSNSLSESSCASRAVATSRYCNRTPTVPTGSLGPSNPMTLSDLTCTITATSTDADNDPIEYKFYWYEDNVLQSSLTLGPTNTTTNTLAEANTQFNDTGSEEWTCGVSAVDNQNVSNSESAQDKSSVTLINTPVGKPTVDISSNSRIAGATINCAPTTNDPDVDDGTQYFDYTYTFYKNGDEIEGFNPKNSWFTTGTVGGEGTYTCKVFVEDVSVASNTKYSQDESEVSTELVICNIYETWDSVEEKCVANTDVNTFICADKPEHSQWDDVSAYTQTFDGSNFIPPATTTTHASPEENSQTECYYICEEGFKYENGVCVTENDDEKRSAVCDLPQKPDGTPLENYKWTANNLSSYTQSKIDGLWVPAEIQTMYVDDSANADEPCRFVCKAGYSWNGSDCVAELDYCGLVNFRTNLKDASIGPQGTELTFDITCADPDDIPGGTDTLINSVEYQNFNADTINIENIGVVCLPEPTEITTIMDTNVFGSYQAIFSYGPEEFGCSRATGFGLTTDFGVTGSDGERIGGTGGENLAIPDNNLLLVLLILLSVSIIVSRKRLK